MVSIHAPVRGATIKKEVYRMRTNTGFNPRTREGCDYNNSRKEVSH